MSATSGGAQFPHTLPELSHNPADFRYEARIGGVVAGFADYTETSGTLLFTHTEVDPGFGGQGVGSALARFGLDDARRRNLQVVPLCSFIQSWIERHPDYADLLDA